MSYFTEFNGSWYNLDRIASFKVEKNRSDGWLMSLYEPEDDMPIDTILFKTEKEARAALAKMFEDQS